MSIFQFLFSTLSKTLHLRAYPYSYRQFSHPGLFFLSSYLFFISFLPDSILQICKLFSLYQILDNVNKPQLASQPIFCMHRTQHVQHKLHTLYLCFGVYICHHKLTAHIVNHTVCKGLSFGEICQIVMVIFEYALFKQYRRPVWLIIVGLHQDEALFKTENMLVLEHFVNFNPLYPISNSLSIPFSLSNN